MNEECLTRVFTFVWLSILQNKWHTVNTLGNIHSLIQTLEVLCNDKKAQPTGLYIVRRLHKKEISVNNIAHKTNGKTGKFYTALVSSCMKCSKWFQKHVVEHMLGWRCVVKYCLVFISFLLLFVVVVEVVVLLLVIVLLLLLFNH